jgi:DNA-binding NarL/FixJ family response regulator
VQGQHEGSPPLRLVIVDDDDRVRSALCAVIEADAGVTVVGEATDAAAGSALCARLQPDVVILDVSMPEGGGPAAAGAIRSLAPRTGMVAWSAFDDRAKRQQMADAGVDTYVTKGAPMVVLLDAIRSAAQAVMP